MLYRILPSFKTLETQSICYWKFYVSSVFHSGAGPRPWMSWCWPCHAISWAGWTQMPLEMVALGFQMQQGGHKGYTGVWKESNSLRILATVSTPLVKQCLAWQIQIFMYLDISGACFCHLLSHSAGKPAFSLQPSPLRPFGSKLLTFLRSFEAALSHKHVLCIFTVTCYFPYK